MDMIIKERLIEDIGLERYNHTLRVTDMAIKLANIHGGNAEKTKIAAMLHDCGKLLDKTNLLKRVADFDIILDNSMKENHELIHGPLGARIAEREYGIRDQEILDAIYYHTIARENMTLLDKIIYIADYIEPNRNFPGLDQIRQMAYVDLNKSIQVAMERTIIFLIEKKKSIHVNTVKARNYLLIEENINKNNS